MGHPLAHAHEVVLERVLLLVRLGVLDVLLDEGLILCVDLLLELLDLVRGRGRGRVGLRVRVSRVDLVRVRGRVRARGRWLVGSR